MKELRTSKSSMFGKWNGLWAIIFP